MPLHCTPGYPLESPDPIHDADELPLMMNAGLALSDNCVLPYKPAGMVLSTPLSSPSIENVATSSLPLPPPKQTLMSSSKHTPLNEDPPDLGLAQFRQSLGLPNEALVLSPPIMKAAQRLRLPPFDGMAMAVQDARSTTSSTILSTPSIGVGAPSPPSEHLESQEDVFAGPLGMHADQQRSNSTSQPQGPGLVPSGHATVDNYVLTQTPPDDSGVIDWALPEVKQIAGSEDPRAATSQRSRGDRGSLRFAEIDSHIPTAPPLIEHANHAPWLSSAMDVILDSIHQHTRSEAIKILSHALPSPSAVGHAFPAVVDAIQQSTSSNSIMWMNVWHAVSGRFNFEDLPKSPPTTPAAPNEGDDYFTQRVFDYAVEVPDYSQRLRAQPLGQQRPAIAPCSIDVSIVERYIPATNTLEFEGLFSATSHSFLNDRLIELSTHHGNLLLIYPTRLGAETFKKAYLDPILDPTLRSMMISYGLHVNLVSDIGTMVAIEKLLPFDEMESRIKLFLNTLNNAGTSPHNRFHRQGAKYSLLYSEAQQVYLDRDVWAKDWWNKQEKLRIQRAFETHDVQSATMDRQAGAFQASAHLATASRETQQAAQQDSSKLVQRAQTQSLLRDAERSRGERNPGDNEQMILRLQQDVVTRPYRNGLPTEGIEVGVFVIQKTHQAVSMFS